MKVIGGILAALLLVVAPLLGQAPSQSTEFVFNAYDGVTSQDGNALPPGEGQIGFQASGFDASPGFYAYLPFNPDPTGAGYPLILEGCAQVVFGPKTYNVRPDGTLGDGTKAGDTFSQTGPISCAVGNGYQGSVTTNYTTIIVKNGCKRGGGRWTIPYTCPQSRFVGGEGSLTSLYVQPAN